MMVKKKIVVFLLVVFLSLVAFLYFYVEYGQEPEYRGTFVESQSEEEVL